MTGVRLDDDARDVLRILRSADVWMHALELQHEAQAWPIRPVLDSLRRRKLIEHDGQHDLTYRHWRITRAGRDAIA